MAIARAYKNINNSNKDVTVCDKVRAFWIQIWSWMISYVKTVEIHFLVLNIQSNFSISHLLSTRCLLYFGFAYYDLTWVKSVNYCYFRLCRLLVKATMHKRCHEPGMSCHCSCVYMSSCVHVLGALLANKWWWWWRWWCWYCDTVADATPPQPALPLLDWQTVQLKMQWGVIMLLGGGFAIADAVKVSCRWQSVDQSFGQHYYEVVRRPSRPHYGSCASTVCPSRTGYTNSKTIGVEFTKIGVKVPQIRSNRRCTNF